jgi:PLP dependent protein
MASIDVAANLAALRDRIATACAHAGRSENDVRLVAISKRIDLDRVASAVRTGQLDLGENRLPDAVDRKSVV